MTTKRNLPNFDSSCPLDWSTPGNYDEMEHALSDCGGCGRACWMGRDRSCAARYGSAKRQFKLLCAKQGRAVPRWIDASIEDLLMDIKNGEVNHGVDR